MSGVWKDPCLSFIAYYVQEYSYWRETLFMAGTWESLHSILISVWAMKIHTGGKSFMSEMWEGFLNLQHFL